MAQVYALEMRGPDGSQLCEVEHDVCYYIGDLAFIARGAQRMNRESKARGWGYTYRAVPLPYTTSIPDWYEYGSLK